MDSEIVRPLIAGTIGALLALWTTRWWARFVPMANDPERVAAILEAHRWRIRITNVFFFGPIVAGIILFKSHVFASNDAWAAALIIGTSVVLASGFLTLSALMHGRKQLNEAVVAFAISQRTPLVVLALILVLGVGCFFAALVRFA